MSKDEYLITDAPLKALTVFAMPMILCGFGSRCRSRCTCEPLFWSSEL